MADAKICTRCNVAQPLDNYSIGKGYVGGRRSWCKRCCRETNAVHKASAVNKAAASARLSTRRATDPAFREKQRLKMKAWREQNVFSVKAGNLAQYGLTLDEYGYLYSAQDGKCAICATAIQAFGIGRHKNRAHVDHDHATGHVRGLLCMACNVLLGAARDSPDTLRAAIEYLNQ